MDGIACALNKKCRESKSKEIVEKMAEEEKALEAIYSSDSNENNK
ncbi:hypothetical protein JCM1393_03280 [Clostridium carnis]